MMRIGTSLLRLGELRIEIGNLNARFADRLAVKGAEAIDGAIGRQKVYEVPVEEGKRPMGDG